MTVSTLIGTGTLYGRAGDTQCVHYLLENSPDLLSLGCSQQSGTLKFPPGEKPHDTDYGPLALDLEDGRRVHITLEDDLPLDAAETQYAIWWW